MKVALFAISDWYLFNFRRALAEYLLNQGLEVIMISAPGGYGLRLQSLGFRWFPIPMDRRSINPARESRTIMRLARLLRREKVDLVHNFTIKAVVYGGVAAQLSGTSCRVHAVTGLGYVFTAESLQAGLLRVPVALMFKMVLSGEKTRLILQNPDDVEFFQKMHLISKERIRLIRGSGVNVDRFNPLLRTPRNDSAFRVLLASRLLWDKGISEYVQAAGILRQAGRAVEFLLAGARDNGNPSSVSQEQVELWRREGVVTLLGHVDAMESVLKYIDAAVLPTSYGEGVPRALLEAAACGLPLIATDVPGCREIVMHKVNGLLIPCHDPRALAGAIAFLMDNPERCREMGIASRRKVVDEFDERLVFQRTSDVYSEVNR
jgi:glycosyltransferase involved in cell wall biosynthesis